jgi:hypothetical protein
MSEIGARLREVMNDAATRLMVLPESEVHARSAPSKWSKAELLGHLIDSAANNHQRFVRAQRTAELTLPGYEQEFWVSAQGYADAPWPDLVTLWRAYNLHLARAVERIPADCAAHVCVIGANEPVTLEYLVVDYLNHLEHHLRQLLPTPEGR